MALEAVQQKVYFGRVSPVFLDPTYHVLLPLTLLFELLPLPD